MFVDLQNIQGKDFYEVFGMEYHKGSLIESLLQNCSLPNVISGIIWERLYINAFTDFEADEIIEYLRENQLDRIQSGFNYTQTDIKYKLKNES